MSANDSNNGASQTPSLPSEGQVEFRRGEVLESQHMLALEAMTIRLDFLTAMVAKYEHLLSHLDVDVLRAALKETLACDEKEGAKLH